MRNLLITLVVCAITGVASAAGCPATTVASPQARPAAELISAAAAQTPLATAAEHTGAVMLPASVHSRATQVMGAPGAPDASEGETPRHGSRLAMVLAGLGVMLVIVLRWLGASR
jgi:hypothetical protein